MWTVVTSLLAQALDGSGAPIQVQPVGVSPGTYWSIAASVVTVAVGVVSILSFAKRWANRYLVEFITQNTDIQAKLAASTGEIAKRVQELANDVRALSEIVQKLGLRLDTSDVRLETHLIEAHHLKTLLEEHLADHTIHLNIHGRRRG